MAANSASLVTLFSPGAYTGDVSHLDDIVFPNDLMKPARDPFPTMETRQYSAVNVGILRDFGYTPVSAATVVPEPGEWATMGLAAFGLGGLMLRARRKK